MSAQTRVAEIILAGLLTAYSQKNKKKLDGADSNPISEESLLAVNKVLIQNSAHGEKSRCKCKCQLNSNTL